MSDLALDDLDKPAENGNGNLQRIRWKNRRRMAWISLLSMIAVTAFLFTPIVPESRLAILTDVITWFYFSMASIIGFYMGATTWAAVKKA